MPPNEPQPLSAAIYARVSTEEQREGMTIDSQVAELERFAREKGWQITDIYKDNGWSGTLLARPELDRLRDDASKGRFAIVLLNDVDRLARDVSHLGVVKRSLERGGVQIIFRKLPAEKSPTYNLMVNILGSFAEFEREMIVDRTRRGRRHKVEVRQLYLGGTTAYGYRYILKDKTAGKEGYLELVAEEALTVKQMFAWVDKEGLSARQVTERLNRAGISPPKGGWRWGKSSVLRILRNEMYAGTWYYNKYEAVESRTPSKVQTYRRTTKTSLRRREKSEWLPVILPDNLRIVSREQWQRVQQQLDNNITFSSRNSKHVYLLSGLIRCGGCGARYVGDPNHGRFYYRCHTRCKRYPTIQEKILNSAVWEAIKEAILNPALMLEQVSALYAQRTQAVQEKSNEQQTVEEALQRIAQEEERIVEAYRLGILSPAQLGDEMKKLRSRRAPLEAQKVGLQQAVNPDEVSRVKCSVEEYCATAAERMEGFSLNERVRFLRLLIDEIIFEGNRVRIQGAIPVTSSGPSTSKGGERDLPEGPDSELGSLADQMAHSTADNSLIATDRIATTRVYRHGHNSVDGVPFEVSQNLPTPALPLKQQIDAAYLQTLIKRNPSCTLKQLCDWVREEQGITISTTAMCRLVKGYKLHRRRNQRPHTRPRRSLALAA